MTARSLPLGVTFASLQGAVGPDKAVHIARRAADLGYRSCWTADVVGPEAFALLGSVAAHVPALDLGTGVVALQLRTPPLLAMAGATLQALVPEREVLLGIGISSPVVAGRWHGAEYGARPLAQVREFVTLLRLCLSGEQVDFQGDFYQVSRFRLGIRLDQQRPKVVVGALNAGMLRLAGEMADGALLNYLPASHVPWSIEQVRAGGDAKIYCYVHVGVTDRTRYLPLARRDLFSYATVDAYAANFTRAGYGEAVRRIRECHAARDRDGALAAVSEDMVDGIDVMGDADAVSAAVRAYADAGVDEPIVFPLPFGDDPMGVVEATMNAAAAAF
ncbi:MAG: LLM class F420-dependent oxidoreductase [Acidimicrobiia bacterium]|nr:LLM class F420-dependent oxidoreductase [Acidimicrobiia bacterium]